MKLSVRNQLADGVVVTVAITNEAVEGSVSSRGGRPAPWWRPRTSASTGRRCFA
jgi:hypothetical protein